MWPVAFTGGLMVQKPLVEKGKIVGWDTTAKLRRPYAMDNAGYAFSVRLMFQSTPSLHFISHFYPKFQMYDEESGFLEQLNITLPYSAELVYAQA